LVTNVFVVSTLIVVPSEAIEKVEARDQRVNELNRQILQLNESLREQVLSYLSNPYTLSSFTCFVAAAIAAVVAVGVAADFMGPPCSSCCRYSAC
jgi:hypothetical protein